MTKNFKKSDIRLISGIESRSLAPLDHMAHFLNLSHWPPKIPASEGSNPGRYILFNKSKNKSQVYKQTIKPTLEVIGK